MAYNLSQLNDAKRSYRYELVWSGDINSGWIQTTASLYDSYGIMVICSGDNYLSTDTYFIYRDGWWCTGQHSQYCQTGRGARWVGWMQGNGMVFETESENCRIRAVYRIHFGDKQ